MTVTWAHDIYESMMQREIMQAWLISGATDKDVNNWLRVPEEVTQAYRHLFFDVDIFRDELDILAWISEYEQEGHGTALGVQLLQTAYAEGVDKMAHLYGRGKAEVDPVKVQTVAMTEMYHRGRAHRGASLSSREASAAHNFMTSAVKIAQVLGNKTAPDLSGLRLKLRFNDQTEPVNDAAERGEEFLH